MAAPEQADASEAETSGASAPGFDLTQPPTTAEREVLESEFVSVDPEADLFGTAPTMPGDSGELPPVTHSGRRGDRSGELIHERYRLLRELGRGGMGTVYLAEHTQIHRTYAIKILNDRYLRRADIAERFLQEARAVSRIEHPNVVGVTDFGRLDDGTTFLVMEHLAGESLAALCKREAPLPWPRVRHLMLQVCQALAAAHAVDVVHRDIKPDNVLRVTREDDEDFVKVLDFGLAKLQGGLRLTRTGMVIGTPEYMAPEQARGLATDARTDIYSVGILMYELLCGSVPFSSKSFIGMRNRHLLAPPEAPSERAPEAGISEEVDAIVLRALAKDPKHRFASMEEMIAAIEDVGTGKGPIRLLERRTLPLDQLAEMSLIEAAPKLDQRERPDTRSQPTVAKPMPRARPPGLLLGVGIGVAVSLLAVAAAALMFWGGSEPEPAEPAPVDAVQVLTPSEIDPVGDPDMDGSSPGDERVVLRFVTKVEGPVQVLSARDRAVLGTLDDAGEFVLPRSDDRLKLLLRAPGHADYAVELTPDHDRSFEVNFEPKP